MGVVVLGHDEMLSRDVAVKFLLNAVAGPDDPHFTRFLEGARAAAGVRHSGLTAIHQAECVNNVPYIIMEYIDGLSLAQLLFSAGSFSLIATRVMLRSICSAVGALHDAGITHRDIKPSNVLVDNAGCTYVTDFGLAVTRGEASASQLAGSPFYMAPTMFQGKASPRTDVYSLGIMTFELLTGRVPFTGTREEIYQKHVNDPLPTVYLHERGVGAEVIEAIERACHKEPAYQYKTAHHFLRAIGGDTISEADCTQGLNELCNWVGQCRSAASVTTRESDPSPPSSYSERLSQLANERRKQIAIRLTSQEAPSTATFDGKPTSLSEKPPEGLAGSADSAYWVKPPESRDISELVLIDYKCVNCHYNLKGLTIHGGRCPECGQPVDASVCFEPYLRWKEDGGTTLRARRFRRVERVVLYGVIFAILTMVGTCAYSAF